MAPEPLPLRFIRTVIIREGAIMSNQNRGKWTRREVLQTTGAALAGFTLGGPSLLAQPATVPQTRKPMKIGIIGSGQQGGSIGMNWARAGHEVLFSSRNPDTL